MRSNEQRQALGNFLRARREGLTPVAAGLPAGGRRRTPGLRREEIAQLCGLSTTWYAWIEQGRDVSVSSASLARLAEGLRLDTAERRYLFSLAGQADPNPESEINQWASVPLRACLDAISIPAYALNHAWSAVAWNAPAERLMTGWLDVPGDRNVVRYIFLNPAARTAMVGWEERARRVVAEFRAEVSAYLDMPETRALIGELRAGSDVFARYWEEQHVTILTGGPRAFVHPIDGVHSFEQVTFRMSDQPGLRMVMLVPTAT